MEDNNSINISIVIPFFNTEEYLPLCLDSLIKQKDVFIEIFLINDGSTDSSLGIANEYAEKDSRIKVIHQKNSGASSARNNGLKSANGEYVLFIDSDDRIKENSLVELYKEAVKNQADVVMGKVKFCYQDGSIDYPFKRVSDEMLNKPFSGKESFCRLIKSNLYLPMPFSYLCRRKYLEEIQIKFEEGIIHEDELWSPILLCKAERMVLLDNDFYYYRQHQKSVMHTTKLYKRLDSLFHVADQLMKYSEKHNFFAENEELKSWWYVNVFKLYCKAFMLLAKVKDTSYIVPQHYLERLYKECNKLRFEPQQRCKSYYRGADNGRKIYLDWLNSEWVTSIAEKIKTGMNLMLIYNTVWNKAPDIKVENVPKNWVITTDRRFFTQAVAVVFHIPTLRMEIEGDLEKREGQVWICRYTALEKESSGVNNQKLREVIDLWICIPQDETQQKHPLVQLCRDVEEKFFNR